MRGPDSEDFEDQIHFEYLQDAVICQPVLNTNPTSNSGTRTRFTHLIQSKFSRGNRVPIPGKIAGRDTLISPIVLASDDQNRAQPRGPIVRFRAGASKA